MLIWAGLILLAVLLQSSVFGMLPFPGVKPDIVLIIVMFASFVKGARKGALTGFAGGLIEDFASGGLMGVNAFVKAGTGYVLGCFRKKFDYSSRGFQVVSVLSVSLLSHAGAFLLMRLSGHPAGSRLLGGMLLASALFNAALGPFIFSVLERLVKYDKSKSD